MGKMYVTCNKIMFALNAFLFIIAETGVQSINVAKGLRILALFSIVFEIILMISAICDDSETNWKKSLMGWLNFALTIRILIYGLL